MNNRIKMAIISFVLCLLIALFATWHYRSAEACLDRAQIRFDQKVKEYEIAQGQFNAIQLNSEKDVDLWFLKFRESQEAFIEMIESFIDFLKASDRFEAKMKKDLNEDLQDIRDQYRDKDSQSLPENEDVQDILDQYRDE